MTASNPNGAQLFKNNEKLMFLDSLHQTHEATGADVQISLEIVRREFEQVENIISNFQKKFPSFNR